MSIKRHFSSKMQLFYFFGGVSNMEALFLLSTCSILTSVPYINIGIGLELWELHLV